MKYSLSSIMKPAPVNGGFSMEGYWVWCGSVIKGEDGRYHMFASRWPKTYPTHPGWLLASEIVRAVSDTPEGPYEFAEVVLGRRGAQYWDGIAVHNPFIMKSGDTYILYYIGTTHPFTELENPATLTTEDPRTIVTRSNKRIGMATAKSVFGPWTRADQPIVTTRPHAFDNFLVSNPAPCQNEAGEVLMIYKSRRYMDPPQNGNTHGDMQLGVLKADCFDGAYHRLRDDPIEICGGLEVEDPFLWKDEDGYNMIAKDMTGNICGEKYAGIHALSQDGIHWTTEKDRIFYSRKVLWSDGVVREVGNMERPFILFEDGKPICAFFATSDCKTGRGILDCTETWNMSIPLDVTLVEK